MANIEYFANEVKTEQHTSLSRGKAWSDPLLAMRSSETSAPVHCSFHFVS